MLRGKDFALKPNGIHHQQGLTSMLNYDDMILTDDKDNTVDFFARTIKTYKKIGISWSCGADSTFTLWWFAKCLHDNNLTDHYLLPSSGLEFSMRYTPYKEMEAVLTLLKKQFPKANILPHHTYDFMENPNIDDHKGLIINKTHRNLINSNKVDIIINSVAMAPDIKVIDLGSITAQRDKFGMAKKKNAHETPWRNVDKQFIAYQYKKYNLLDILYPLTHSCVSPDYYGNPCKNCNWCKEKYWGFGMYDRKQQKKTGCHYYGERVLKNA
jgi:hypothetical protein